MEVAFKLQSRIIWEIGDDADLNDNKRGRLLAQLEEDIFLKLVDKYNE